MPRGQVDTPSQDEVTPRAPVKMLGWCLFPESSVARVDVVVDAGPATSARLGIERPDVGALSPHPCAPVCGFELVLDLGSVPVEKPTVTVETVAHAMDGRSVRLASVTLTLGAVPVADEGRSGRAALLRARSTPIVPPGAEPGADRPLKVLVFSHELLADGRAALPQRDAAPALQPGMDSSSAW